MANARVSASGTGDVALTGSPTTLMGFNIAETATTPAVATVTFLNGSGGSVFFTVELAANTSVTEWFGDEGIFFPKGVYLDRVAGETTVSVFIK